MARLRDSLCFPGCLCVSLLRYGCGRTAATMMAELGVLPHIVEAILNHISGHKAGIAGVYNRARYTDEMRSALQRWSDHIDTLTR